MERKLTEKAIAKRFIILKMKKQKVTLFEQCLPLFKKMPLPLPLPLKAKAKAIKAPLKCLWKKTKKDADFLKEMLLNISLQSFERLLKTKIL